MGRSNCISLVDKFDDLFFRGDEMFSEALNLDLLVFVFKDFENGVVVE